MFITRDLDWLDRVASRVKDPVEFNGSCLAAEVTLGRLSLVFPTIPILSVVPPETWISDVVLFSHTWNHQLWYPYFASSIPNVEKMMYRLSNEQWD